MLSLISASIFHLQDMRMTTMSPSSMSNWMRPSRVQVTTPTREFRSSSRLPHTGLLMIISQSPLRPSLLQSTTLDMLCSGLNIDCKKITMANGPPLPVSWTNQPQLLRFAPTLETPITMMIVQLNKDIATKRSTTQILLLMAQLANSRNGPAAT